MEKQTVVPGIVKVREGVLLNKDNNALRAYRQHKKREFRSIRVEQEIDNLKSDVAEIKEMIQGLVRANGIS